MIYLDCMFLYSLLHPEMQLRQEEKVHGSVSWGSAA